MPDNGKKAKRARYQDRQYLLSKVPEGAQRIQVIDELGKKRYRPINALRDGDFIQVKKDGDPIVMRAPPGRKETTSKVAPVTPVVAKLVEKKRQALKEDLLLNLAKGAPESTDVLQEVMVGLANEAASIRFERSEAERQGKETSSISMRSITALKAVGDTWLRRTEQVVTRTIDLESTGFGVLFGFIMETFRVALEEAQVSPDMIKVVFSRFSKKIGTDEWKLEAKNRMKRNL